VNQQYATNNKIRCKRNAFIVLIPTKHFHPALHEYNYTNTQSLHTIHVPMFLEWLMMAVLRMGQVVCSLGCFVEMQYRSCWMKIGDMLYTRWSFTTPAE